MNSINCKCGKERRKDQRYCNSCHNSYMRVYRIRHSNKGITRLKANCRAYTKVYLKRGKISKENCEVCGKSNVQAHHTDYNKPLLVKWLCNDHHKRTHEV